MLPDDPISQDTIQIPDEDQYLEEQTENESNEGRNFHKTKLYFARKNLSMILILHDFLSTFFTTLLYTYILKKVNHKSSSF